MAGFFVRRTFQAFVALWLASVLIFVGVRALPGDPVIAMSGETGLDAASTAALRSKYGLDAPVPVQYLRWVGLAITGDLGTSIRSRVSVTQLIAQRLPITLQLAALSMLVAVGLGVPLGVAAAVRRGRPIDHLASASGVLGLSIPNFWLALMLILVFAVGLGWLPASGHVPITDDPIDSLRHMVLPSIVLGTGLAAILMRQTRSAMVAALRMDFVRMARAKGLPERQIVIGHALRNSLVTVVTIVGLELGALISGAVVTESIFLIPGFGRLILDSVAQRDYPIVQGVALVSAAGYVVINLLVDIAYGYLNPKIRTGAQ